MSSEFEDLQREGKLLAAQGKLWESLRKFEQARKIKETPKILNRIQKLKDFISENNVKEETNITSRHSDTSDGRNSKKPVGEKSSSSLHNSVKESSKVLSGIQNTEVIQRISSEKQSSPSFETFKYPGDLENSTISPEISTGTVKSQTPPVNPNDLTSDELKKFNELKKMAMELTYAANFEDALETFSKALTICACPKIKKYCQEIKVMASQYHEKLHKIQKLTDTGKKLAKDGKCAESLKNLKNAFAVCPSPSISKMIKSQEAQIGSTKYSPNKNNPIPFKLSDNSSKEDTFSSEGDKASMCTDPTTLSPAKYDKFQSLYRMARKDAAEGRLQEALNSLLEAKSICQTDKLLKRICDIQEHMKSCSGDNENDKMVAIADEFCIFHEIYEKLYPYQRNGVAWMWKLYKKKKGGILGDDMGLGKTFQIIAFLSGLIDADFIKHVLIIMPVSLLPNWEKEFKKWAPGILVSTFHGGSKKERERTMYRVQRRGHVLLTSYGMVVGNLNVLTEFEGREFVWDYVILDEGHKIKNPTKTTKAVHGIPSRNRLVLTGTPIQNNLIELWALFDFAHKGTLLGSMKTFKMTYETLITRSREKDATAGDKRLGTEMANNLKKLIDPYFLRRTKREVWGEGTRNSDITDLEQQMENLGIQGNKLTRKNDLIMWIYLSDAQCEIYRNFLHSEAVKTILVSKRSPLVELTILKKICDHPRLLSRRACLQLGLNGKLSEEDLSRELDDEASYASSIENVADETLIEESGKMRFLINLLENLKANQHRTLVFSLSRKILDMVHRILVNKNWKVMRIDGTISKIEERERRIQLFQKDSSYSVFLLTTQVGGVGITLTAADRVIIYDPSWNPATDAQAVDRVYRIGQQKDVVVYRLITCGSVEEKIYRRQIFKDSITRQATGASDPYRYFSKQELRELFSLDNPHHSATQVQLSEMHSAARQSDIRLDEHIAFLHSLNIFGISDHDLMFSKSIDHHNEDNDESAVSQDFIQKQVLMAQTRIQDEAAVVEEGIRLAGSYCRAYSEHVPVIKRNLKKDSYIPPALPEIIDLTDEIKAVQSPNKRNSSQNKSQEGSKSDSKKSVERNSIRDYFVPEKFKNNNENRTDSDQNNSSSSDNVSSPEVRSNCGDNQSNYLKDDLKGMGKMKNNVKNSTVEERNTWQSDTNLDRNRNSVVNSPGKNKNNLSDRSYTDLSSEITSSNTNQSNVSASSQDYETCENVDNIEVIDLVGLTEDSKCSGNPSNTKNISVHVNDDNPENISIGKRSSLDLKSQCNMTNTEVRQDLDVLTESRNIPLNVISTSEYRSSNVLGIMNASDVSSTLSNDSKLSSSAKTSLNSPKNSINRNSHLFEELDLDEKPLVKKNNRRSCAILQNFISESDSSQPTSCASSANNSDDEIISGSDDEIISGSDDEISSGSDDEIISGSDDEISSGSNEAEDCNRESKNFNSNNDSNVSVVPSSIPNSPVPLNSTNMRKDLSIRRITPLKLRKSYVSPQDSAFARALASSPVVIKHEDVTEILSSDSSTDIESPVLTRKKKKNIIVSDSEEEQGNFSDD